MTHLQTAIERAAELARAEYGDPEYKYYAIPHRWRNGRHSSPLLYEDDCEIDEATWLANKDQSKRDLSDAFMGKLNRSYTEYRKNLVFPAWREKLIEAIKALPEFEMEARG